MEVPENNLIAPELKALDEAIRKLPDIVNEKIKIHEIFKSIHKKMIKGFDYHEILNFLFTSLDVLIPYDRIGIALLEDKNKSLRLSWVKSKLPIDHLKKDYSTVIMKGSSLEEVIFKEKPKIIKDLHQYFTEHPNSKTTELALQDNIQSNLTYPLIINGNSIGVIFFSSSEINTYNETHVELFSEIAEEISLIVEQGLLRKLTHQAEEKEKLFRTTIHELNNPLGVIRGVLGVIEQKDWFSLLAKESKSIFQILKRKNEAMICLVKDLAIFNQLKGPVKILKTKIILENFLDEILLNAQMLAKKKNIKIILNRLGILPSVVNFDSDRIMQAVENLVANAINYSHSNTNVIIDIKADEAEEKLFISVKDQGQGIPKLEQGKLFTEYGKTSVKPTDGETSTGLGLAIVKAIVESHNGDVSVQSTEGIGSTFSFWIPFK